MATGIPFGWQVENANGVPVSGAKVYFYQPGTVTPRSPYTDDSLTVPSANPVEADSAGWFNVYLSSDLGYDIVIKSADDSITYQERTAPSTIENAQPVDATLTMLAGLAGTDGDVIEFTGSDTGRVRKPTVATKSALQALTSPQENDVVRVLGGSSVGDGYEGNFRWVTGDQSANVTADTTGAIWVPLTGEDGSTGAWKRIFTGAVRWEWFGGQTAAALYAALNDTTANVIMDSAFDLTLTSAQVVKVLEEFNRIEARVFGSVFQAPDGEHSLSDFVDINNPYGLNISFRGVNNYDTTTATGASNSGSTKNYTVQLTGVADTSDFVVGRFARLSGAAGTGDPQCLHGTWEVTAKTASTLDLKVILDTASFPTMSVTAMTVKPQNCVLKWPSGCRGMAISGILWMLRDVVLEGGFNYSSGSASDGPDDGLQIGPQANTSETGLSESHQLNFAGVWMANVSVVNWTNNGIQIKGGFAYGVAVSATGCGWRGIQAGSGGTGTFKSSSVAGTGASCYETEGNGNLIVTDSFASGGTEQGFYSRGGRMNAVDCIAAYNKTIGLDADDQATVLADGFIGRNNVTYGLQCASARVTCGSSASFSGNGTADVRCIQGGVVNGAGASSLGTTDIEHDQFAVVLDTDGDRILPPNRYEYENGAHTVRGVLNSGGDYGVEVDGTTVWQYRANGKFRPGTDNAYSLGEASRRPSELFAGTGTVNTSDARAKKDIAPIPDYVLDAWAEVEWCEYRFIGRNRLHTSLIAQTIQDVFERHGIDPFAYGVLCYDEWDDEYDDEGNIVTRAGDLYGVRYDEAQALEAALVRRALKRAGIALA